MIGLAHGNTSAADPASRDRTYEVTKQFLRSFGERHGSTTCRDLLGVDIATPDGRRTAMETGLFKSRCPVFVRDAAATTARLVRGPVDVTERRGS